MINASPSTMAELGKNEIVSMTVIIHICQVLHCDIGDVMEVILEENELKKL